MLLKRGPPVFRCTNAHSAKVGVIRIDSELLEMAHGLKFCADAHMAANSAQHHCAQQSPATVHNNHSGQLHVVAHSQAWKLVVTGGSV